MTKLEKEIERTERRLRAEYAETQDPKLMARLNILAVYAGKPFSTEPFANYVLPPLSVGLYG